MISLACLQIEPYFTALCLYDAKQGRKISEDFYFDCNDPYIRNLLPKAVSKHKARGSALLPDLSHAPLEWLSYPRQVGLRQPRNAPRPSPRCGEIFPETPTHTRGETVYK